MLYPVELGVPSSKNIARSAAIFIPGWNRWKKTSPAVSRRLASQRLQRTWCHECGRIRLTDGRSGEQETVGVDRDPGERERDQFR
jgi:hypothetical protein